MLHNLSTECCNFSIYHNQYIKTDFLDTHNHENLMIKQIAALETINQKETIRKSNLYYIKI